MLRAKKIFIAWIVIALALCGIFLILYIMLLETGWANSLSFSDLQKKGVGINSAETFVEELLKNDAMGAEFGKNRQYVLEEDIELSETHINALGNSNLSFWGELNGNGHKVMPAESDLVLKKPLFYYIQLGAKVAYVEFSGWMISVADGQAAALFGTNEGILQNVKLSDITLNIEQLYPGKENPDTAIAALALNNAGTIKNCVADISVQLHNENISNPNFKCVIGGLVAKNFTDGRIEDIIIDVEYPGNLAALDIGKNRRRNDVGVVIGCGDIDQLKNITVISNNLGNGKNAYDIYELQISTNNTLYIVSVTELVQKFGTESPWQNNNWNNDGTWWGVDKSTANLPTLKPAVSQQ